MTTAAAPTLPYGLSAPELFHAEQIITQIITADDDRKLTISRVVHSVGERSITLSSPQAPSLGVEEWGTFDHPLSELRPLTDLLPPNVGIVDKFVGLPRTTRTLIRNVGTILTAQRIPGAGVSTPAKLNGPLGEAWVFVSDRFASYTLDLLNAYLPWQNMTARLRPANTAYEARRVIIVAPTVRAA